MFIKYSHLNQYIKTDTFNQAFENEVVRYKHLFFFGTSEKTPEKAHQGMMQMFHPDLHIQYKFLDFKKGFNILAWQYLQAGLFVLLFFLVTYFVHNYILTITMYCLCSIYTSLIAIFTLAVYGMIYTIHEDLLQKDEKFVLFLKIKKETKKLSLYQKRESLKVNIL